MKLSKRALLFAKDPRCFWCGRVTVLQTTKPIRNDNVGTIDHLYSRLHPKHARNIHYWLFSRALAAIWRGPTLKTRASPSCRNVPTVLIWPVRCVRRWLRLYPGFRQQQATPVSKSPRQPHPVRGSQGPALSTSMLAYRPLRLCEPPIKAERSSYSHRKTKHPPLDPTHIKQGPDHS